MRTHLSLADALHACHPTLFGLWPSLGRAKAKGNHLLSDSMRSHRYHTMVPCAISCGQIQRTSMVGVSRYAKRCLATLLYVFDSFGLWRVRVTLTASWRRLSFRRRRRAAGKDSSCYSFGHPSYDRESHRRCEMCIWCLGACSVSGGMEAWILLTPLCSWSLSCGQFNATNAIELIARAHQLVMEG